MRLSAVLLALPLLVTGCASTPDSKPAPAPSSQAGKDQPKALPSARTANVDTSYNTAVTSAVVGDVIKGDELTLSDGSQVRLIGIRAPIAHVAQRTGNYFGKGAIDMTRELLEWKPVRLEYDKQTHDRRGRLLAYAYTEDGRMLQEELLRAGHAMVTAFPPNVKHHDRFMAAQAEAMQGRRGLWGYDVTQIPRHSNEPKYSIEGAQVKRVINGTSIELDDGTVVRYIGIDAADSENRHLKGQVGHATFAANRALVQGKELVIEYDVDTIDPRGRDLAYVYADGVMINAELVRQGHAIVAVFPPNVKHINMMLEAQAEAAREQRGLWSAKADVSYTGGE
jgi:endonuclease YncB( thermonuclease family)